MAIPDLNGYETVEKVATKATRVYIGFPLFHAGGIVTGLIQSVYCDRTIVLANPDSPPTASTFATILNYGDIDGACVLPPTLQDIAKSSSIVRKLTGLKFVVVAGGA